MTTKTKARGRAIPLLDVFYPIVPDLGWLERIVPLGARTVQLRLKDASVLEARRQIAAGLALTRAHGAQLIVNDYWQLAIEEGADFIHLGQEDLAAADLKAIKAAGLKLGVSTHDEGELETALLAEPDYIALGPVYETLLKKMSGHRKGSAASPLGRRVSVLFPWSPSAASRPNARPVW